MNNPKIHIIAVEGLDCSGKTTFTDKLFNALKLASVHMPNKTLTILQRKFPRYITPMGHEITKLLNSDLSDISNRRKLEVAFMYDRNLWATEEWPLFSLSKNVIIVCDRYSLSLPITMAPMYKDVMGKAKEYQIEEDGRFRNIKPELNVLLRLPLNILKKRIKEKKNKDSIEKSTSLIEKQHKFMRELARSRDDILSVPAHLMDPSICDYHEDMTTYIISLIGDKINDIINDPYLPVPKIVLNDELTRLYERGLKEAEKS